MHFKNRSLWYEEVTDKVGGVWCSNSLSHWSRRRIFQLCLTWLFAERWPIDIWLNCPLSASYWRPPPMSHSLTILLISPPVSSPSFAFLATRQSLLMDVIAGWQYTIFVRRLNDVHFVNFYTYKSKTNAFFVLLHRLDWKSHPSHCCRKIHSIMARHSLSK